MFTMAWILVLLCLGSFVSTATSKATRRRARPLSETANHAVGDVLRVVHSDNRNDHFSPGRRKLHWIRNRVNIPKLIFGRKRKGKFPATKNSVGLFKEEQPFVYTTSRNYSEDLYKNEKPFNHGVSSINGLSDEVKPLSDIFPSSHSVDFREDEQPFIDQSQTAESKELWEDEKPFSHHLSSSKSDILKEEEPFNDLFMRSYSDDFGEDEEPSYHHFSSTESEHLLEDEQAFSYISPRANSDDLWDDEQPFIELSPTAYSDDIWEDEKPFHHHLSSTKSEVLEEEQPFNDLSLRAQSEDFWEDEQPAIELSPTVYSDELRAAEKPYYNQLSSTKSDLYEDGQQTSYLSPTANSDDFWEEEKPLHHQTSSTKSEDILEDKQLFNDLALKLNSGELFGDERPVDFPSPSMSTGDLSHPFNDPESNSNSEELYTNQYEEKKPFSPLRSKLDWVINSLRHRFGKKYQKDHPSREKNSNSETDEKILSRLSKLFPFSNDDSKESLLNSEDLPGNCEEDLPSDTVPALMKPDILTGNPLRSEHATALINELVTFITDRVDVGFDLYDALSQDLKRIITKEFTKAILEPKNSSMNILHKHHVPNADEHHNHLHSENVTDLIHELGTFMTDHVDLFVHLFAKFLRDLKRIIKEDTQVIPEQNNDINILPQQHVPDTDEQHNTLHSERATDLILDLVTFITDHIDFGVDLYGKFFQDLKTLILKEYTNAIPEQKNPDINSLNKHHVHDRNGVLSYLMKRLLGMNNEQDSGFKAGADIPYRVNLTFIFENNSIEVDNSRRENTSVIKSRSSDSEVPFNEGTVHNCEQSTDTNFDLEQRNNKPLESERYDYEEPYERKIEIPLEKETRESYDEPAYTSFNSEQNSNDAFEPVEETHRSYDEYETSSNDEPETSNYDELETFDYGKPETYDYGEPETYNYGEPETYNYGEPETYNYGEPETSKYGEPETSKYGETETYNYGEPETYNYGQPETSKYGEPKTYKYGEPESSYYGEPETSMFDEPETSNYGEPETFNYAEPETSNYEEPKTSNYGEPETYNYGKPETSYYGENETSMYGESETSMYGEPGTSNYAEPETSNYEEPETSTYGEPETYNYGEPETYNFGEPNGTKLKMPFIEETYESYDEPTDPSSYFEQNNPNMPNAEYYSDEEASEITSVNPGQEDRGSYEPIYTSSDAEQTLPESVGKDYEYYANPIDKGLDSGDYYDNYTPEASSSEEPPSSDSLEEELSKKGIVEDHEGHASTNIDSKQNHVDVSKPEEDDMEKDFEEPMLHGSPTEVFLESKDTEMTVVSDKNFEGVLTPKESENDTPLPNDSQMSSLGTSEGNEEPTGNDLETEQNTDDISKPEEGDTVESPQDNYNPENSFEEGYEEVTTVTNIEDLMIPDEDIDEELH